MLVSVTAFWPVIQELLNITRPDRLVEIGGDQGVCTQKLCAWADPHQAHVDVIEPQPTDTLMSSVKHYRFARLHVGASLKILPILEKAACYVIDGDHNYYTVYNELKLITQSNKPDLILLHDIGWPWGRRDIYYDVNSIPDEHRHDYVTDPDLGIVPGHPGTFHKKGLRGTERFTFAKVEGGPRNGVLTAVQDFLTENSDFQLMTIDCVFGLGILVCRSSPHYPQIVSVLGRYVDHPLLSLLEEDRLQSLIDSLSKP